MRIIYIYNTYKLNKWLKIFYRFAPNTTHPLICFILRFFSIRPSSHHLPRHIFTRRTELYKTRRQRLSTWFCVNDVFFSYTCIASYVCTTESILSYLNWNLTTLCWCICKLWVGYYVCYHALRCRAVRLLWLVIIMVPCSQSKPRLHMLHLFSTFSFPTTHASTKKKHMLGVW